VRHDRQRRAADALGLGRDPDGRYPVVVDAAGTTASLGQAVGATERGGRVVLVALPWDPIGIPITAVFKEVTIVPAVYYGRADGHSEFARAGHILAAHPELAGAIVTHRFGLVDGPAAFAVAADRAAGAIKVQVLPDEVGL
jgi:threonine dehydrogenase-like Zn-dependent dehydrogenase